MSELVSFGGRPVQGFSLGAEVDPCKEKYPFQGFFGYSVELPVLKAEDVQTDQYMKSLNEALSSSCPTMRDVDKTAWQALYQKWQTIHAAVQTFLDNPPWFGANLAAAEHKCRIDILRAQADDFQKMSMRCNPQITPNILPQPPPPSPPGPWLSENLLGTVKVITVAGVAIAGVVYLAPLLKRALSPEKK